MYAAMMCSKELQKRIPGRYNIDEPGICHKMLEPGRYGEIREKLAQVFGKF